MFISLYVEWSARAKEQNNHADKAYTDKKNGFIFRDCKIYLLQVWKICSLFQTSHISIQIIL